MVVLALLQLNCMQICVKTRTLMWKPYVSTTYQVVGRQWSWHFLQPLPLLRVAHSCTVQMHNPCELSIQLFFHTLRKWLQCQLSWQWLYLDCRWKLGSWWTWGHSYWWHCWSVFCQSWLAHLVLILKQTNRNNQKEKN